jgi:hypothetical protein
MQKKKKARYSGVLRSIRKASRRSSDQEPTGYFGNEPFGSRPEPGAYLVAPYLRLPPGEVPEGRARGVQDAA